MNNDSAQTIRKRILETGKNGKLPCVMALTIAAEEKVSPAQVGDIANALNVKIVACQLGCFK